MDAKKLNINDFRHEGTNNFIDEKVKVDPTELRKRALQVIEFLYNLYDGTAVSAGDVAGFLAGWHDSKAIPEDEIEIIGNKRMENKP